MPEIDPQPKPVTEPPADPAHTPPAPTPPPVKPVAPQEPAKPATEPQPEPPAKQDDPEEKWPRSGKDWDAFKKLRKEREQALIKEKEAVTNELKTVRAEIETLKKQGPSPELDALKKERDELSEHLRLVSVENHPKFKAYFDNKTNAQIELAKRIAPEQSAQLEALLKQPDSALRTQQLREIASVLEPFDQSRLGGIINALDEINAEKQREIGNAKTNYERLQSEQQAQAKAKEENGKKFVEKLFSDALAFNTSDKESGFLYQEKPGDETWNAEVKQRVEFAKAMVEGRLKPEQFARGAFAAAAAPAVLKFAVEIKAENDKLKAQVAALTSASPGAANGDRKSDAGDTVPIQHKASANPMDAVSGWMKNLQAARTE